MESHALFAALREALAELYPKEQDAVVVVTDAGLDARQIAFSSRAQTNWHNILTEAIRQNRLDALLQVVRTAYGDNPALQATYDQYRHLIDQGDHIEPPAPLAADSGPTPAIETEGGAFIAGNVTAGEGDFIGRDQQIEGDKVGRDKIEGDQIDARDSKGFINRPAAPVTQHFSTAINIGALKIPIYLVIIISVCMIGIFGVVTYPLVEQWMPITRAFAAQADGETLIVIATFHNTAATNSEAHTKIRRAITSEATNHGEQQLRVEVEPTELTADQRTEAEALGKRHNASMVIWGEDTGVEVIVSFLNLKEPDFSAADARVNTTEQGIQLAKPDVYVRFITRDLPGQMSFLALFAIGQAYYAAADYPLAASTIEQAVASVPKDDNTPGLAAAYFQLGLLYQIHLHEMEKAIPRYLRAFTLDPKLGYADQGKLDEAIQELTKAITLNPKDAESYRVRGFTYDIQGKLDEAIQDFTHVITLNPKNAEAYFNRGNACVKQGKLDEAIQDFTHIITLNPKEAVAYFIRGVAYTRQGKLGAAIADYDKAIALQSDYADAYNSLCWTYALAQQPKRALPNCQRAIELDPQPDYYDSQGLAYALLGDLPSAIADFQKFVDFIEASNNPGLAGYLEKRKAWIADLKAGKNPFTPDVLEELQKE
jgi:tetratricopeptide (TPR) repeat protein